MPERPTTSEFSPIGYIDCAQRYRYEAPRQGALGAGNSAIIRLNDDDAIRQALTGLEGFDRAWVIYELHLNETWNPLVQPPHEGMAKIGTFATRSPHRPNRIGLSCVELQRVDGLNLHIRNHDLLDRTPILDIKPYVPYADAFPEARAGWLDDVEQVRFAITVGDTAQAQLDWIAANAGLDAMNFIRVQLVTDPTDGQRKRIEPRPDEPDGYTISYRTWRIDYAVDQEKRGVHVTGVRSGYSAADLAPGSPDRHGDKDVHRQWRIDHGHG
jgi:tRNA-Thr(GGU) m(6)t(6)A37 methyltransferase TsaA